jgi:exodeoxyribonuclease V beta subunit
LRLALSANDEVLARADEERLGEDLRKLYVALTRARFATWIGVAPLKDFERTAVGYLLQGGAPPAGSLEATLHARLGSGPAVAIASAPEPVAVRYEPRDNTRELAPELVPPRAARESWWIASYSGLRVGEEIVEDSVVEAELAATLAPESAIEATYLESRADTGDGSDEAATGGGLHDFPRGPSPGSFLHGLLEWAGRQGFAATSGAPRELATFIARRCQARDWGQWAQPLQQWLAQWLVAPLDLSALGGSAVSPAQLQVVQVEMEFWFAATHVDAQALDRLVRAHTLGGAARPALLPQQLNGMLKGFIDLVFEHEGRYYVADYKSNRLGAADADYTPAAMRAEVLKHRYELQYALYLFALHRLLRARLPDYDYDCHVGGAVYLFLRGHAAASGGLHLERPPKALMEALDRLFAGQGAEVAA